MEIILIALVVALIASLMLLMGKGGKVKELEKEVERLSPYKHIVDAEKEAAEIRRKAVEETDKLREETSDKVVAILENANATLAQSKISAAEIISESQSKADENIAESLRQSQQIISDAEAKAKEIAGDAYEVAQNAKEYEKTAKAMKNIIEGYGDEYIKPSYSVFGELAIYFGYTEAGQQFKDAQAITKALKDNGEAATCDYVENNRRETAIAFVLDAFNGKADSILARVKKDNYGKLKQQLFDARAVVNHLGAAFRNARITDAYFDSRLKEIQWAVVLLQLKLQEKEEQRKIKEQMREEERARREYERAMRDAQKEEELIRKAMEKARAAIEKASEEQKQKYEEQLADLQERLKTAEEKNQRALSMAQQTKSGYVYVISNIGSFGDNIYKIGMTRRLEPLDRVRELGDASVPFPFDVHALVYSDNAPAMETELHRLFVQNQVNKVNPRKEFFRVSIGEIRQAIDAKGLDVKWTMAAEAAEYKETLAIERSINASAEERREWEERQSSFDAADIELFEDEE